MKVLLISAWKPKTGGIVTHVEKLIEHSKNKFTILTYNNGAKRKENNVIRVPYLDKPILRGASFALFSFLKGFRTDFDIIHAHYAIPQGFSGVLIKRFKKKPLLLTVHGSDATVLGGNRLVRPILKWVLNSTDRIIAVSQYAKNLLIDMGISEAKIRVIHNGVDSHTRAVGDEKRVIYLGALVWQKGVDVLLKAFKDVKAEHRDAKLVIVGDGPERMKLEGLASKLKLKDVDFTGYVDDLDTLFTVNSILVLPSRLEGFGISILEAMARGVPVAASKTGGIPEIVEDGKNGVLFTRENPVSLADAVNKVLDDPGLRNRLVEGGLKTAKKFSWDNTVAETEDVYRELARKVL
jgi:N-acetyl-alpha-D-glucosaminyl L-malate synthase BshA